MTLRTVAAATALLASQMAVLPAPAYAQDGQEVFDTAVGCNAMYTVLLPEIEQGTTQYRNVLIGVSFWSTLAQQIGGADLANSRIDAEINRVQTQYSDDAAAQNYALTTLQNCMAKQNDYRASITEARQLYEVANFVAVKHMGAHDHWSAARCGGWLMVYSGMIEGEDADQARLFNEHGEAYLELSADLYTGNGNAMDAVGSVTDAMLAELEGLSSDRDALIGRIVGSAETCADLEDYMP